MSSIIPFDKFIRDRKYTKRKKKKKKTKMEKSMMMLISSFRAEVECADYRDTHTGFSSA